MIPSRSPTADELVHFRAATQRLGVSSEPAERHLRATSVRRHALFLSAGDPPDCAGLVVSGVVREYYVLDDGTERTRAFALPGDTFGSLSDVLMHRPSRVFVRAEADTCALLLSWATITELTASSRDWERLRYSIVEQLYLRKSVREYELLALDAMGRYQSLLQQHPNLEAQVPQLLIASYLGITPVHLSRLRRRLRPALKGPAKSR